MRYVNLGVVDARWSQAVYHALAHRMKSNDEPTLVTVSPNRPYVCVGYHQLASREIDRVYCEQHNIPVGRRWVGGGAVYLDQGQVFWHLILPKVSGTIDQLYRRVLSVPIATYQAMGIEATFRPVNDIVVGPRKIGGTGASTIGIATVVVGSLMWDFNMSLMARVLRVPSEKFRDKMVKSLEDYMTTISRELRSVPDRSRVTDDLVERFAALLGEPVHSSVLTAGEVQEMERLADELFSPTFVYGAEHGLIEAGVKIRSGVYVYEGVIKAPGGLVRFIYRDNEGVFEQVSLSGDFFLTPWNSPALAEWEKSFEGQPINHETVQRKAQELFDAVSISGVRPEHIVACFLEAQTRRVTDDPSNSVTLKGGLL
ncbi:biotin/lipoate A/B protein ligase family protein [Sulfobacillus sp. hq2]|uniref:lipoate--protein ligase family protein n=1 Tax=Sulfobacillus TaxID=28033 RepID=UPI001A9A614C|nr:biotin/lipoate A/B protein ligase family protein [Sulfobacillus sp. hq2]